MVAHSSKCLIDFAVDGHFLLVLKQLDQFGILYDLSLLLEVVRQQGKASIDNLWVLVQDDVEQDADNILVVVFEVQIMVLEGDLQPRLGLLVTLLLHLFLSLGLNWNTGIDILQVQ